LSLPSCFDQQNRFFQALSDYAELYDNFVKLILFLLILTVMSFLLWECIAYTDNIKVPLP